MTPATRPKSNRIRHDSGDQSNQLPEFRSRGPKSKGTRHDLSDQLNELPEFASFGPRGGRSKRIRSDLGVQSSQMFGFRSPRPGGSKNQSGNQNIVALNPQDATREQIGESEHGRTTRSATESQDDATELAAKKKRVRGPTCMPKVWGQPVEEPMAISFNDLGQPNDEQKTSTLSHFLGTIARNGRYCPLQYKDWRLMPQTYKDEMINTVKTKFELPPGQEPYIWKSINKKWRNWKNYLKSLNFEPDIPIEQQLVNVPTRVDEEQYRMLVEHWKSDKFKKTSEKNRDTRGELKLFHRMGKKSFARVKEIMKKNLGRYPTRAELFKECYYKEDGSSRSSKLLETIEQLQEIEEDETQNSDDDPTPTPDDAFAKVLGTDKHGYVRMYGMGVKPADIYGTIPSRDASYRLAMEYKDKYLKTKDQYDALNEKVDNLAAAVHGRAQPSAQNVPITSQSNQRSSTSISQPRQIRVNSAVVLKSLGNINEIVASGYVCNIGSIRVNGEELGSEWCEITIQSDIKKDVRLLKPYDHIQTIGDSIGAPVAWPLSLVALDENEF